MTATPKATARGMHDKPGTQPQRHQEAGRPASQSRLCQHENIVRSGCQTEQHGGREKVPPAYPSVIIVLPSVMSIDQGLKGSDSSERCRSYPAAVDRQFVDVNPFIREGRRDRAIRAGHGTTRTSRSNSTLNRFMNRLAHLLGQIKDLPPRGTAEVDDNQCLPVVNGSPDPPVCLSSRNARSSIRRAA
jgi:hypothetical protein